MKTDPKIYLAKAVQENVRLRDSLQQARRELESLAISASRHASKIQESVSINPTHFAALFKKREGKWECLAVVDIDDLPDNMPEDFDLVLPIPEPESLPEFQGW